MTTSTIARPSRFHRRSAVPLAAAAALALLLAACGGDDEPEPDPPVEGQTDDDAGDVDDDPVDADDDPADDGPDGDADGDADGDDADAGTDDADGDEQAGGGSDGDEVDPQEAYDRLLGFGALVESQVTYVVSGFSEVPDEQATMIIAQSAPRVVTEIDSPDGRIRNIVDTEAQTSIACFEQGGTWECLISEDTTAAQLGAAPLGVTGDSIAGELDGEPDRAYRTRLLDRDVLCLEFSDLEPFPLVELCFDDTEGIMLRYLAGTGQPGEQVSIEATAVGAPDPQLFEPPAEPFDARDFGG